MLAAILASLALLAQGIPSAVPPPTLTQHGQKYGKLQRFSGVYFTNFENSAFTECAGAACDQWAGKPGYNVTCTPAACEDLDRRIRQLNGSPDNWATFAMTFEGRRSLSRHKPRSLGDRGQNILVDRIVGFTLIEGRPD